MDFDKNLNGYLAYVSNIPCNFNQIPSKSFICLFNCFIILSEPAVITGLNSLTFTTLPYIKQIMPKAFILGWIYTLSSL